jgi:hypothetical protein
VQPGPQQAFLCPEVQEMVLVLAEPLQEDFRVRDNHDPQEVLWEVVEQLADLDSRAQAACLTQP